MVQVERLKHSKDVHLLIVIKVPLCYGKGFLSRTLSSIYNIIDIFI